MSRYKLSDSTTALQIPGEAKVEGITRTELSKHSRRAFLVSQAQTAEILHISLWGVCISFVLDF